MPKLSDLRKKNTVTGSTPKLSELRRSGYTDTTIASLARHRQQLLREQTVEANKAAQEESRRQEKLRLSRSDDNSLAAQLLKDRAASRQRAMAQISTPSTKTSLGISSAPRASGGIEMVTDTPTITTPGRGSGFGSSDRSGAFGGGTAAERAGNVLWGSMKDYAGSMISSLGTTAQAMGNIPKTQYEPKTFLEQWAVETSNMHDNPVVYAMNQIRANPESAKFVMNLGQDVRNYGSQLSQEGQKLVQDQKRGLGTVGKTLVDVGSAGTQMVMDIGLGLLTGLGMAAPMAVRVFGSSAEKAASEGATLDQQTAYAFGTAAVAFGLEHIVNVFASGLKIVAPGIGDDAVMAVVDDLAVKLAKTPAGATALKTVGTILASGAGEGFEEVLEDFIQPYLQKLTYDPNAKSAFEDPSQWADYAYDGLIGFILGTAGSGVNVTLSTGANTGEAGDMKAAYEKYRGIFTDQVVNDAYESLKQNGMFSQQGRKDLADANKTLEGYKPSMRGVPVQVDDKAAHNAAQGSSQSVSESDGAPGGAAPAVALAGSQRAKQADTNKTEQQKWLDAFARAVQENNHQQAEAAKPKDDLTPAQKAAFDGLFGRNKKTVSESDTGAKTQGADSAALRKQINDAYASGELNEAEYDDALDALMEQESLEGINTLNRYNPEMMRREVNDNGRSSISDESGEWYESAGAGEQVGKLAESAGRDQSRTVQSQRAGDRADRVLRVYQSEGRQPVTARSYLGSEKVEDAGQIYDVPQSVIDGDTELSEIAADIRSRGMVPHLFTGEARLANGAVADAMIRGNDVYIRVDSPEWTATQNWEHEKFHGIIGKTREMLEDLFVRLTGKTTPEKLRQTIRRYREAYHGIVDVDGNGNPVTGEKLVYNVVEEILADAYAGKDTFSQNVERFSEISQDAASQIEESGGEIRGPLKMAENFSISETFHSEVDKWLKETHPSDRIVSPGYFRVGEVSDALKSIGVRPGNVFWRKSKIGNILIDHPEISEDTILDVPKVLESPYIVLKSRTRDDSIVLFGDLKDKNGDNVMAALELTPKASGRMEAEFTLLTSSYGRTKGNIKNLLANSEILFISEDKKRADTWSKYLGVQFPSDRPVSGSIGSIAYEKDGVKISGKMLKDIGGVVTEKNKTATSENFSASGAPVEIEVPQDPVQALPKKAQRYLESKELTLTNSLGEALRIPFKNRKEQLQDIAREITTEFLQTGDVSEKTLDDLFERAYRPNERKLAEKMGVGVEEYREQIENDFKAQAGDLIAQLRLANRYAADQTADGRSGEKPVPTLEDIPKLYDDMKAARRAADKAVARNLLTESDNAKVNRLLRGDIDETMLNPLTDNVQGILEVFHAKEEYEKFAKEIRRWNARRKEDLRALADKLLETAGEWKDKPAGLLYSRETMERNIRDIVKDKKVADEVINTLFKPIHEAAAKANTMKNVYRDRVRALNLSRKVAGGNKISEAAAVQLLGEAEDNIRYLQKNKFMKERDGKTLEDWNGIVRDLWENNPNLDAAKIRNAVNEFREIYDELFEQMNGARMRNGYEPINYRKGYFPHFQSDSGDGILAQFGRSLGINTAALQLPTTINGMTHTFKPGIQWFGSAQQRQGVNTAFDAVEGFDSYIEGVADVIHQTDNIQRLRAFATQVRYRTGDEGLRKQVDAVRNDPTIAEEDKQNRIKDIYENGKFELGNFAVELDEYTNLLAGKKSRHDRDMEQKLGRRGYAIMKAMESRVAANMVAINPGSWLTNFIPITQGAATLDSRSLLAGMWDTLRAIKQDDGMVARSSFLTNRRGSDPIVRTWAQKTSAKLSKPMEIIDSFTADTLVRARYKQNIRQREMSEEAAIADADAWAAGVMADRSKGAMPTLFSQTNPFTKLLTQFQLEVNNQLSFVFKDIPREMKEKGVAALTLALLKFMIGAYLYNEIYERFIGRRPALDPLGIINDTVGDLTGYEMGNLLEDGFKVVEVEKKGLYDAGLNLGKAVAEELPFVGGLLGGGRLPINSALPDFGKLWQAASDSDWDAKKRVSTAAKELAKPAAYILPPFGGGQVKKIAEGTEAMIRGGSYSVDSSGADILQYPVYNDTFGQAGLNAITAMVFGKSSLGPAREWVESGFDSLSAKETDLFDSLRNNGANSRDAYDLIRDLQELETKLEKITEIATAPFGEMLKEAAMSNQMSFSQYEKYMAARKAGVSTEQYAELLRKLDAEARSQKEKRQEGKPTTSQIESEMWSDNLTPDERRALWDSSYNLSGEYEAMLEKYADETEIGAGSVSKKVLEAVLKEMKLTKQQKDAIRKSYGW